MATSVDLKKSIWTFQKQCAFSEDKPLVTGSFGPCYVLTGWHKEKHFAFLAHIDDTTIVKSIDSIFKKIQEQYSIKWQEMEYRLMGGFIDISKHLEFIAQFVPESKKWGNLIKEFLEKEKEIKNINLKHFQKDQYFKGLCINPQDGRLFFFERPWKNLDSQSFQFFLNDRKLNGSETEVSLYFV